MPAELILRTIMWQSIMYVMTMETLIVILCNCMCQQNLGPTPATHNRR